MATSLRLKREFKTGRDRGRGKKRQTNVLTIKEDLDLSGFPLDMIYYRKL